MPVVMPQLGESIVEATLAAWRVRPGASVRRGEPLADVETDKATNEVPSPRDGVVGALLVDEGATVPVGTPILAWSEERATAAPHGDGPVALSIPPGAVSEPGPGADRLPSKHLAPRPTGRAASPAVRRIARQHAIDLDAVPGSGKGGRITRRDVEARLDADRRTVVPGGVRVAVSSLPVPVSADPVAHAAVPPPPPSAAGPSPSAPKVYRAPRYQLRPGDELVPFSRRRQFIAEHMVHSLGTAAHVAAVTEIDMSAVQRAQAEDADRARAAGVKLTLTAYVSRAVARALGEFPELNATVLDDQLVLRRAKNLGIAVDTRDGLVVPVVHGADELGLIGLARRIGELSDRARAGKLGATDVADGSFTISNPGRDGNLFGVSIIRQPEVGILRIGSVVKRPVVRTLDGQDAIVIRPILYAALSYDHRVIDGRTGNGFLHRIRTLLESVGPEG